MQTSLFHSTYRWFLPGLIAGVVFLAIALLSGALSTTVWAMPEGIARTLGVSSPVGYSFALAPVLVGVVVHLVLSIGLGAIFTAIAPGYDCMVGSWSLLPSSSLVSKLPQLSGSFCIVSCLPLHFRTSCPLFPGGGR